VDAFQAIADPIRRRLIEHLGDGELAAGELVDRVRGEFGVSQPAVSKHLRLLREAGLVTSRVDAQRRIYRVQPRRLAEIARWVDRQQRFWTEKLDALERGLTKDEGA
jgi:DNA-binding transcriptional ArsR family regulator